MSVDKLLRLAIEKHEQHEYEEAGKLYKKILATKPRHLDANYLLGTLYSESGDYEKALQFLIKAAQINPNSAMVLVNLGNVYRKLEIPDLAVKHFKRARQLMPKLYQAQLGLGSALMELGKDYEQAAECLQKARELVPAAPDPYHQIGMLLARTGNDGEALAMLEVARNLNPAYPDINLDMGKIYLKEGKNETAAEYFREACRIAPNDTKGAVFLAIAEGRVPEKELMQKYSANEFDSFAASFENRLIEKLQYSLPFKIVETLKKSCSLDIHFDSVIDLGCGTGLAGEALRNISTRLTGIDISEKMIAIAAGKKCYDQLYCGDIITTLTEQEHQSDLFIATDVLVYIGDMNALMAEIVAHAAPGALFLFSTELLAENGFALQSSGRYAHSTRYVHEVMKAHGCSILSAEQIDLRLEAGSWLKGELYIVRLNASSRCT